MENELLHKTENNLIFIEKDRPYTQEEMDAVLKKLKEAVDAGGNDRARQVLHEVLPAFTTPEEANQKEIKRAMVQTAAQENEEGKA